MTLNEHRITSTDPDKSGKWGAGNSGFANRDVAGREGIYFARFWRRPGNQVQCSEKLVLRAESARPVPFPLELLKSNSMQKGLG